MARSAMARSNNHRNARADDDKAGRRSGRSHPAQAETKRTVKASSADLCDVENEPAESGEADRPEDDLGPHFKGTCWETPSRGRSRASQPALFTGIVRIGRFVGAGLDWPQDRQELGVDRKRNVSRQVMFGVDNDLSDARLFAARPNDSGFVFDLDEQRTPPGGMPPGGVIGDAT
jgi:hypothetical protein